jgi:hypothetical protein
MCRNAIHDTSNSSGPISRSTRQSPAPPMVGSVHARDGDPQGVRAVSCGCGERGQRGGAGSRWRRGPVVGWSCWWSRSSCWAAGADPPGCGAVSVEAAVHLPCVRHLLSRGMHAYGFEYP